MSPRTEFYQLFLDDRLNYSSGYFEHDDVSLDHAQQAKTAAVLTRCDLSPGLRLLDIGCGWGSLLWTAARQYGVHATGITTDRHQYAYLLDRLTAEPLDPPVDVRLQAWEDYREPTDRIVCVNAFENFADKPAFLRRCADLLSPSGRMVMVCVTADRPVFRVMPKQTVVDTARSIGFEVEVSPDLGHHYARTLDHFGTRLEQSRSAALEVVDEAYLDRKIRYFATCAGLLRTGQNQMHEFTFTLR
ncbi:cyclopropane-fatty-acyl-phospholipid synthase family protein [Kribbella sp. NBC_01505]|uniref:class I SAM-dependent methyltransferase n=1 Tax=Kribbella sp. NBC_01505 TaxID=2903580 RepID=UPI00386F168F